jgi:hypothetical protein
MLDEICPDCMTWHEPPRCGHNADAQCPSCGLPRGYLTPDMQRDGPCWFCVSGTKRRLAHGKLAS